MKRIPFVLLIALLFISCKNDTTSKTEIDTDYSKETLNVTTSIYPENITKVFDAHGGIDVWNTMQSLEFTMKKPDGDEVTLTNLKSRESLITMPDYTIGYDGNMVWLNSTTDQDYSGNPKFYYNLMFYFYAMPFILADDGINYQNVEPQTFENTTYPGIKISYENEVGESPEDEYILYYNPDTYKMEWLGYTVTYFTKEKSKKWSFIKYSNWQTVKGLLLPETLTWYKVENNVPVEVRNDLKFTDIKLSKAKVDKLKFTKPEDAKIIQ
ncbi:DUF6503 family protein [Olleya sp. YS]|uniref:DUF6503 family protein n=1 Tax=Olleya sp. YS TaxID=3028318 RepID=UPI002434449B|nr:DUF6503 family protein [Olleya sp. YS]WGD33904.1 hypothetical protein Ollyesu_08945 [Olleya sp. YS]